MTSASVTQRLLVLAGDSTRHNPIIDMIRQQNHEVLIAQTIDEALLLLRNGEFDAVFSDSADFLPLERAVASQQSGLILDTIGEGICIADETGQLLWSNKRMRAWSESIRTRLCQVCSEAYRIFTTQVSPMCGTETATSAQNHMRSKKFSLNIDENQYFEVVCSPVVDNRQRVTQVVAICSDATSGRRLQQKIDAIDQAGRELVRLEGEAIAKLNVGQRLKLLEEKIIRFCRQLMNFDHFAIRLLDRRTNKLELVICVGMPTEAMEVELFGETEGNGISGYVAKTGRSYICSDVDKDPRYVTGLSGARSSLTVPLMLHDKVIGIFNIESQTPASFSEDDRQFSEIFGRYVAVALNILDLLVVERYTTSGQLAKDVISEVAAPLNDITSEITMLMDDYIGDEDLRKRLAGILENVTRVHRSVRDVSDRPKSILGCPTGDQAKRDPFLEGKRILIADDEPNIRQILSDLLMRYGCTVDLAQDGAEAMSLLSTQQRYDLVLSDINMPHKNGHEIFMASKKLNHAPPVILMTGFGYDPNHSIVRASQEGLAAVLYKPFRADKLMQEIRKALGVGGSPNP